MAFFGLTVNANSTQEVAFPDGAMLSISQIALDEAKDGQSAIVQLQIAQEDFLSEEEKEPETKTFTICKLTSGKVDQVRVNLKLFSHEEAKISVKGQGTVHITGFLVPDPSFDEDDMEDEDEDEIEAALAKRKFGSMEDMDEEEEDEEEETSVKPPIKQQKTPQGASPAAPKPQPQQGGKPQGQQGGKPQGGKPQQQQGGKPQGQQGGKPQGQQGGRPQGGGQGKRGGRGGKH